jgi:hypothetical protein
MIVGSIEPESTVNWCVEPTLETRELVPPEQAAVAPPTSTETAPIRVPRRVTSPVADQDVPITEAAPVHEWILNPTLSAQQY